MIEQQLFHSPSNYKLRLRLFYLIPLLSHVECDTSDICSRNCSMGFSAAHKLNWPQDYLITQKNYAVIELMLEINILVDAAYAYHFAHFFLSTFCFHYYYWSNSFLHEAQADKASDFMR